MAYGTERAPFPRGDGRPTPAVPGTSRTRTALAMASLLLIVAACVLAAYPFLADRFGAWQANQQFSSHQDRYAAGLDADAQSAIAQAEAYNAELAGDDSAVEVLPYDDQLASDDGIVCWLEIPRLGLKAPVRHGTGNEVLMEGAGHIEGSSLPVGGEPSNVVVTGHSGMRQTRMFDQLDLLEPGDPIVLWTCGQPYAYEMVSSEIVTPDQVEVVELPEQGEELTLITCRPIGVNSHRLVVHARRVAYVPEEEAPDVEYLADSRTALFAGACVGGGAAVWLALLPLVRRRRTWHLNRMLGERALGEGEVAAMVDSGGEMSLDLKAFRRARLRLFGDEVSGRWRRLRDDESALELDFGNEACGGSVVGGMQGMPAVRLPRGPFTARALDGELSFDVDYLKSRLVFSQSSARESRDESVRDAHGEPAGKGEEGLVCETREGDDVDA